MIDEQVINSFFESLYKIASSQNPHRQPLGSRELDPHWKRYAIGLGVGIPAAAGLGLLARKIMSRTIRGGVKPGVNLLTQENLQRASRLRKEMQRALERNDTAGAYGAYTTALHHAANRPDLVLDMADEIRKKWPKELIRDVGPSPLKTFRDEKSELFRKAEMGDRDAVNRLASSMSFGIGDYGFDPEFIKETLRWQKAAG